MATYEQGILGPFSGKVGTVVGANWRGKNVMRRRPKKSNRIPTEAQQLQREKFTTVTQFLSPLKALLNQYFGQAVNYRSRYNLATSYHLKEAIQQVDESFGIMYNKVMVSKGDLQGLVNPVITPLPDSQLKIEWQNNSGQGMATPDDSLLVVVYCADLKLFETFEQVAIRKDDDVTLTLTPFFEGSEVHCWASFVNAPHKLAASSNYLGKVMIE